MWSPIASMGYDKNTKPACSIFAKSYREIKAEFSEWCRGRATANAPVPLNSNSFSEESATHSGFHENIARARDPTVRTPARIREPAGANKKPPSLSDYGQELVE
jgi:hypothetical protein